MAALPGNPYPATRWPTQKKTHKKSKGVKKSFFILAESAATKFPPSHEFIIWIFFRESFNPILRIELDSRDRGIFNRTTIQQIYDQNFSFKMHGI